MADTASMQQFEHGAKNIFKALHSALNALGVSPYQTGRTAQGANIRPHDSIFIVEIKGKSESLMFTREEILDSAQSIDPFAAAKVRVLVDRVGIEPKISRSNLRKR